MVGELERLVLFKEFGGLEWYNWLLSVHGKKCCKHGWEAVHTHNMGNKKQLRFPKGATVDKGFEYSTPYAYVHKTLVSGM